MSKSELRRATPGDVEAVRTLSRAAYAKWVPLMGREPLPMTADYARAVAEHRIDLLEENGQLIALVETVAEQDHLLIVNIAVRPDRQGGGLGDRLLRHGESIAQSLGIGEVRLYTNAAMSSNIAFYAKRATKNTGATRSCLAPPRCS